MAEARAAAYIAPRMSHEGYHEPAELLPEPTKDLHRALISLQEELEAVDWYQQRADATKDEALRGVMIHNRNEEVEHAMMVLEWIRRQDPIFDAHMRTYLFRGDIPITQIEQAIKAGGGVEAAGGGAAGAPASPGAGSLRVGSLRSA
jgi:ferritin-like protein